MAGDYFISYRFSLLTVLNKSIIQNFVIWFVTFNNKCQVSCSCIFFKVGLCSSSRRSFTKSFILRPCKEANSTDVSYFHCEYTKSEQYIIIYVKYHEVIYTWVLHNYAIFLYNVIYDVDIYIAHAIGCQSSFLYNQICCY